MLRINQKVVAWIKSHRLAVLSACAVLLIVFSLASLSFLGLAPFWSALTAIGTLALAFVTFHTARQNGVLTKELGKPRAYLSGTVEEAEITEPRNVYHSDGSVDRDVPTVITVHNVKLTVSNLSSFPIQVVEVAYRSREGDFATDAVSKLVAPHSAEELHYQGARNHWFESIMVFFFYGGMGEGLHYLQANCCGQGNFRSFDALHQSVHVADKTVQEWMDDRLAEAHELNQHGLQTRKAERK